MAAGETCPFDAPRPDSNDEWDLIAKLRVSSLYLSRNQTYRGHCLLILDIRHATRPDELSSEEWLAYCADLHAAERALMQVVRPDHINVVILGNVVPHLHWHVIPRYRGDPRWGAPIWTSDMTDMRVTHLPAREHAALIAKVRNALGA